MFWLYAGFLTLVLGLLALDLGVLNRKAHVVGVREAMAWSTLWMSLALVFAAFIYRAYDAHWFGLGARPDPDRKSTRLNSSHIQKSRMPSSA